DGRESKRRFHGGSLPCMFALSEGVCKDPDESVPPVTGKTWQRLGTKTARNGPSPPAAIRPGDFVGSPPWQSPPLLPQLPDPLQGGCPCEIVKRSALSQAQSEYQLKVTPNQFVSPPLEQIAPAA